MTRFRQLRGRTPEHGGALRGEGQPATRCCSRALVAAGSRFDVASPAEVTRLLEAGARPDDLVYSNPIKRRADIVVRGAAGRRGCSSSTRPRRPSKVAEAAPGDGGAVPHRHVGQRLGLAAVAQVRLLPVRGRPVLLRSPRPRARPGRRVLPRRLPAARPVAPGTRRSRPRPGSSPRCGEDGLQPWLLDLGGGFPAALEGGAPPLAGVRRRDRAVAAHATSGRVARGRSSSPAGRSSPTRDASSTSVVAVVRRGDTRWVYLDAGVFTGLVETLDEAIRYRLETDVTGPTGPCVLAGPTCDSADVLYEKQPVHLPLSARRGGRVGLHAAGAYTTCYSTVGFNGFAPLPTRLVLGLACVAGPPRLLASHALAAVGMSLPWPLLLVLVWARTGRRRLAPRRRRRGPDAAVRRAVLGDGTARRPLRAGPASSGSRWSPGVLLHFGVARLGGGPDLVVALVAATLRDRGGHPGLPGPRRRDARARRGQTERATEPAGHRARSPRSWSAPRWAGCCSRPPRGALVPWVAVVCLVGGVGAVRRRAAAGTRGPARTRGRGRARRAPRLGRAAGRGRCCRRW